MSDMSDPNYCVACDAVGCSAAQYFEGEALRRRADELYEQGRDAMIDEIVPPGWRALRVPVRRPLTAPVERRHTIKLGELGGVTTGSFLRKGEDAGEDAGFYTFVLCPNHAEGDPEIRGPWTLEAALSAAANNASLQQDTRETAAALIDARKW